MGGVRVDAGCDVSVPAGVMELAGWGVTTGSRICGGVICVPAIGAGE